MAFAFAVASADYLVALVHRAHHLITLTTVGEKASPR